MQRGLVGTNGQALPGAHRFSQFPRLCHVAFPDIREVPGHRDVDLSPDVEACRVQHDLDRTERSAALRREVVEGKGRERCGHDRGRLAFVPGPGKAPGVELVMFEHRDVPFKGDLQGPRHVAPVGRGAHHQAGAFLQQLADAMAVVLRKDARLVGTALEAADAGADREAVDVDPLHFGAGSARLVGHDTEELHGHAASAGTAVEEEDHSLHLYRMPLSMFMSCADGG